MSFSWEMEMHLANGHAKWCPASGCLIPGILRESMRSNQRGPTVVESVSYSGPKRERPPGRPDSMPTVPLLHSFFCHQQFFSCVVVPRASVIGEGFPQYDVRAWEDATVHQQHLL